MASKQRLSLPTDSFEPVALARQVLHHVHKQREEDESPLFPFQSQRAKNVLLVA
jgi:hypothetical protein